MCRRVTSSTRSIPRCPGAVAEILHKIDGPVAADTPTDELEDGDDAQVITRPVQSAEADEDGWNRPREETTNSKGRRAVVRGALSRKAGLTNMTVRGCTVTATDTTPPKH